MLTFLHSADWQIGKPYARVQDPDKRARLRQARIEAIDHTFLFHFPDDITIRLRPAAGQTRIDMRSASRFGEHDFVMNAKRIRKFSTELQAQLDA